MIMMSVSADTYTKLDRSKDFDAVQKEFDRIINAPPTSIHPTDRGAFMDAILSDLEDRELAPWTIWSSKLYLNSLVALKCLSRNPTGSTIIIERLRTLLYHTSLPLPPPASPFSHPPNEPEHPTSLEALKILANVLVLHDAARRKCGQIGVGKAVSKALRDLHPSTERLFLLGRIGFLVTMPMPADKGEVVRSCVDKEGLVDSLVLHLSSTPVMAANYATLAELLKLANNVVRFYPSTTDTWSPKLDTILAPVLSIFHSISFDDLGPPLTNTIHILLSIPFSSELLPIWSHVPSRSSPSSSRQSPPSSSSTFDKLSTLITNQTGRLSMDSIRDSISLSVDRQPHNARRRTPSPTNTDDPVALPARLVRILDTFFTSRLPPSRSVDEERNDGVVLDEALPPVLLLLSHAVAGNPDIKTFVKAQLLPSNLDRSSEAGPLEKRPGILGSLLRLLHAASSTQSRDTAGELLWTICDSDPAKLSTEIGYGNAAGLLFRKGLTGPPEARIEEIPDDPTTAVKETTINDDRNPITSLQPPSTIQPDPLEGLTQEEKEREAERLFVLFDRMERNPVISAQSQAGAGVSANEIMRGKLERGELADDHEEERERKEMEEQDKRDEEEVAADMKRYRERMGQK